MAIKHYEVQLGHSQPYDARPLESDRILLASDFETLLYTYEPLLSMIGE